MSVQRSVDLLNSDVTMAIIRAEDAIRVAMAAWAAVARVEQSLADHPDVPGDERAIANRSVGCAKKTIDILGSMIGNK